MPDLIKIGISTCLLGEKVRYDGGHKHDRYITDTLGRYFAFVPVCPETECGLGIPREAMRLEGDPAHPRLVTNKTHLDHTARMTTWMNARLDTLAGEDLCGFIFKKGSPSSGLYRVKVYNAQGHPSNNGSGLFAAAFVRRFPRIPVEEEGRLHDPELRENFIERIFALKRWRGFLDGKPTVGKLVEFHTREKLLLMAHSPKHYRAMGKLVAESKTMLPETLHASYEAHFMEALAKKATRAKQTNTLMHILGYFKKQLSADEKREVLELMESYRQENVPLIVPVTLMNHFVRKYQQSYLAAQTYLTPHPVDLRLRNHC